jgi:WD40 repeat protein
MSRIKIHDAAKLINDPQERAAYLEKACAGNAELLAHVEKMLGVESVPDDGLPPLDKWVGDDPGSAPSSDPLVGQSIGGVKLVRVIGEGGMGRVYEGLQESPRRTVAVKLVKEEDVTPKRLRKLKDEAQTLARLRHPGIAEIYFSGTFGEGDTTRPFFVMEYVPNAKSLTKYADDLQLSAKDRVSLFHKACDAVAHGHMKGITHRDLKPGNILVDASGQPKIIDFGIAKSLDVEVASSSVSRTVDYGKHIGTYPYMSPEQIDADPTAIDHRSDVYSLGVVLYELLGGRRPHDLTNKSTDEMCRIIKYEDPRPLTSVDKKIPRDIGVIVGKCLEKSQSRRYSGAADLRDDVRRYLAGDPIAAVPPSSWDSVARLARRHRAAAVAVMGIAASLVVAVVGISLFAVESQVQRARATQALAAEKAANAELTEANGNLRRRSYVEALERVEDGFRVGDLSLVDSALARASTLVPAAEAQAPLPLELAALRARRDTSSFRIGQPSPALGGVGDVAVSPDGSMIAVGHGDGSVAIHELVPGGRIRVMIPTAHQGPVRTVTFSPDGKILATVGQKDDSTALWRLADGSLLHRLPQKAEVLAFSPDGNRIASIRMNHVSVWRCATGAEERDFVPNGNVYRIAFSPDGARLLGWGTAMYTADMVTDGEEPDKDFWNWDLVTGEEVLDDAEIDRIIRDPAYSESATFVPDSRLWARLPPYGVFADDGQWFVRGRADGSVDVWDLTIGPAWHGQSYGIGGIAFSADGRRIVSGAGDGSIRIWKADTGRMLAATEVPLAADAVTRAIAAVAFGGALSEEVVFEAETGRGSERGIWSLTTGTVAPAPTDERSGVDEIGAVWDPHGYFTPVLAASETPWSPETRRRIGKRLDEILEPGVLAAAVDPGGRCLATLLAPRNKTTTFTLLFEDLDTSKAWTLAIPDRPDAPSGPQFPTTLVFSGDGTTLAVAWGSAVRIWTNPVSQSLESPAEGPLLRTEATLQALAFSPDGSRLVGGTKTGLVTIWDPATGDRLASLDGHDGPVISLAFRPDGHRVASGGADGTIRLWGTTAREMREAHVAAERRRATLLPRLDAIVTGQDAGVASLTADEAAEVADMMLERRTSSPTVVSPPAP